MKQLNFLFSQAFAKKKKKRIFKKMSIVIVRAHLRDSIVAVE